LQIAAVIRGLHRQFQWHVGAHAQALHTDYDLGRKPGER
jgi:hypothetical protein